MYQWVLNFFLTNSTISDRDVGWRKVSFERIWLKERTLRDVSSLPGRPREISFSLAGSTTAWAVCIFRPISGPNRDLKTSLRVLYFHERSNPDADFTWTTDVQGGIDHRFDCRPGDHEILKLRKIPWNKSGSQMKSVTSRDASSVHRR